MQGFQAAKETPTDNLPKRIQLIPLRTLKGQRANLSGQKPDDLFNVTTTRISARWIQTWSTSTKREQERTTCPISGKRSSKLRIMILNRNAWLISSLLFRQSQLLGWRRAPWAS